MQRPKPIITSASRGENLPNVPPPTPIHWSDFLHTAPSSELRDKLWDHFINNRRSFADAEDATYEIQDQTGEEESPPTPTGNGGPRSHLFLDNFPNPYNLNMRESNEREPRDSDFIPMFIDPILAPWEGDIIICLEPEMSVSHAGPEEELVGICEDGESTQDPYEDLDFASSAPGADGNDPARMSRSPSAAEMQSYNSVDIMKGCKDV